MKAFIALFLSLTALASFGRAQTAEPAFRGQGFLDVGWGTGTGILRHPVVTQFNFGGEGFLYKGFGFGGDFGYTLWEGAGSYSNGLIGSADASYHFGRRAKRIDPFVFGGFSVFGPTQAGYGRGVAGGNFGGGTNWWLAKRAALRLELRDYLGDDFVPGKQYLSFFVGATFR